MMATDDCNASCCQDDDVDEVDIVDNTDDDMAVVGTGVVGTVHEDEVGVAFPVVHLGGSSTPEVEIAYEVVLVVAGVVGYVMTVVSVQLVGLDNTNYYYCNSLYLDCTVLDHPNY
jgi:hypothetical protein